MYEGPGFRDACAFAGYLGFQGRMTLGTGRAGGLQDDPLFLMRFHQFSEGITIDPSCELITNVRFNDVRQFNQQIGDVFAFFGVERVFREFFQDIGEKFLRLLLRRIGFYQAGEITGYHLEEGCQKLGMSGGWSLQAAGEPGLVTEMVALLETGQLVCYRLVFWHSKWYRLAIFVRTNGQFFPTSG